MLIAPNPLLIAPLSSVPVPVISAWCCTTLLELIRASGTVPLVNCEALSAVRFVPTPLNPPDPLYVKLVVLIVVLTPGTLSTLFVALPICIKLLVVLAAVSIPYPSSMLLSPLVSVLPLVAPTTMLLSPVTISSAW